MSLAAQQAALARLYTDDAFRRDFYTAPPAAGARVGLAAAEALALAALPVEQVEQVARSLRRKRLGEVAKLLPATRRALGPRFAALFWQFAATYQPAGIHKHRADALAFACWLTGNPDLEVEETARPTGESEGTSAPAQEVASATRTVLPAWWRDLIACESAWLEASDPSHRLIVRRLGHAPRALAAASPDTPPPRRATLAVWVRPTPHARPRYFTLPPG